jgi:hypothetical protein
MHSTTPSRKRTLVSSSTLATLVWKWPCRVCVSAAISADGRWREGASIPTSGAMDMRFRAMVSRSVFASLIMTDPRLPVSQRIPSLVCAATDTGRSTCSTIACTSCSDSGRPSVSVCFSTLERAAMALMRRVRITSLYMVEICSSEMEVCCLDSAGPRRGKEALRLRKLSSAPPPLPACLGSLPGSADPLPECGVDAPAGDLRPVSPGEAALPSLREPSSSAIGVMGVLPHSSSEVSIIGTTVAGTGDVLPPAGRTGTLGVAPPIGRPGQTDVKLVHDACGATRVLEQAGTIAEHGAAAAGAFAAFGAQVSDVRTFCGGASATSVSGATSAPTPSFFGLKKSLSAQ